LSAFSFPLNLTFPFNRETFPELLH